MRPNSHDFDETISDPISRRHFNKLAFLTTTGLITGCNSNANGDGGAFRVKKIYGRRGLSDGRVMKPRAIDIANEQVFLVDMTGRIQVFTEEGEFVRSWKMPKTKQGRPTGLSVDNDGNLMVCDTHYYRIMFYTPQGDHIAEKTIGGTHGRKGGEFGLVTDAQRDSRENLYIAEYGDNDRIQKLSPDGNFISLWGSHGKETNQFLRPQNMSMRNDQLWVADACNHRIQVFDVSGEKAEFVKTFGSLGTSLGQVNYPYDILVEDEYLYVCEYGNHRIQKMTHDGEGVESWGTYGLREKAELRQPWGMARDSKGRLHVLDSSNHRIQVIAF